MMNDKDSVTIDRDRLIDSFLRMAEIPSHSRCERELAGYVMGELRRMGIEDVREDGTAREIGGNAGNVIARYRASDSRKPALAIVTHLDTVAPGEAVKPKVCGSRITSDGTSILGADCKSGIATVLEVMRCIIDENLSPQMDLELIFTVAEEEGISGVRHLDFSSLRSKHCLVMDSSQKDGFCNEAPGSYKLQCTVRGRSAHSGANPEQGINAIKIAGDVIARLPDGRINGDTSVNIGTVCGGRALNVVPDEAQFGVEIRSFSQGDLDGMRDKIERVTKEVVEEYRIRRGESDLPAYHMETLSSYPIMQSDPNSAFVRGVKDAAERMNMPFVLRRNMAGSDAHIFAQNGIPSLILPTGMGDEHTCDEYLDTDIMQKYAEFLLGYIVR